MSPSRALLSGFTILLAVVCGMPAHSRESRTQCVDNCLRSQVGGQEVEVLVGGAPARTFAHRGETYVLGRQGERYVLRVHNRTGQRVEAVVSVDGLDVIDGRAADFRTKRGYLVPAWGSVDIDGWRLSEQQAAAFRFSSVGKSYAAQTGKPRNVGVIGVAIFPERHVPPRKSFWLPHDGYDRSARSEYEAAPEASADALAGVDGGKSKAAPAPPSAAEAHRESAGAASRAERSPRSRPGLGTGFGEAVDSPIQEVEFVRADVTHPAIVLGARYNDRAGLLALGIDIDGNYMSSELHLRGSASPFAVPVSSERFASPPVGWRR